MSLRGANHKETLAPIEELKLKNGKPAVTLETWTAAPKVRRFTHLPNLGGAHKIVGPNSNIVNLTKGVAERVFFVKDDEGKFRLPPEAHGQAFKTRMKTFSEKLLLGISTTTPWTRSQFVENCPSRKRANYERAHQNLLRRRLERRHSHVKTFIKWEKHSETSKPGWVNRIISPRTPEYNIELGKYLSKIEKPMMKAIDEAFDYPVIMTGRNSADVAKIFYNNWKTFKDPVALGMDAKRFDQHVGVTALKWEHDQWLQWFTGDHRAELARLLSWQLRNTCRGHCKDGKIKYQVDGKRMSGDMNTGSGNKLLMCGMLYAYLRARKINKHRVMNNGDDSVVFIERAQLKQFMNGFEEWFTTMGFTMVVEQPVYRLEEVEFCQTRPVFDGEVWRMVRNYPLALDKDSHCFMASVNGRTTRRWMAGVGRAGLALTGGIPIAQEFYTAYIRNSHGYKAKELDKFSGLAWLSEGMTHKHSEVSPVARASFYAAFGITPCAQIIAEQFYKRWTLAGKGKDKLEDNGYRVPGIGRLFLLSACPQLGSQFQCPFNWEPGGA